MTKKCARYLILPLVALTMGGCAIVPEGDHVVVRPVYPAPPPPPRPHPVVLVSPPMAAPASASFFVSQPPPAPMVEMIPVAPPGHNHVWVSGFWAWNGIAYAWHPGHYERRPHPGAVWVTGRWENRGRGWIWVEGCWR